MASFRYIDLFSGIGGFRVALDSLGGESIGYSEIDKQAIETYRLNFKDPDHHHLGDVTKITDVPKSDLLVGGVPCQSWSVAGRMKGFEDPRGKLWFDTINMVKLSKPKAFIFENVKGLSDPRNRENLLLILDSFKELGYLVDHRVLNAFDFGCPQNRSRIFIVGFQKKFRKEFEQFHFPEPESKTLCLGDFIEDIDVTRIEKKKFTADELFGGKIPMSRNKFQRNDEFNDFFVLCDTRNGHTSVHSWEVRDTTQIQKNICMTILRNRRKKRYGLSDGNPLSFEDISELYSDTTKKDIEILVEKKILKFTEDWKIDLVHSKNSAGIDGIYRVFLPNSEIFSTLTATGTKDFIALDHVLGNSVAEYKQNFINKIYKRGRLRQITPREASRIQGFPAGFELHPKDLYAHKQIGNSVAPPVVKAVANKIIRTGIFSF